MFITNIILFGRFLQFYVIHLVNMAADAFDQTSVNVHVVFLRLTVDVSTISKVKLLLICVPVFHLYRIILDL